MKHKLILLFILLAFTPILVFADFGDGSATLTMDDRKFDYTSTVSPEPTLTYNEPITTLIKATDKYKGTKTNLFYLQEPNRFNNQKWKLDEKYNFNFPDLKVKSISINSQMLYLPISNNSDISNPNYVSKEIDPYSLTPLLSSSNNNVMKAMNADYTSKTPLFRQYTKDTRADYITGYTHEENGQKFYFSNNRGLYFLYNNIKGLWRLGYDKAGNIQEVLNNYYDTPSYTNYRIETPEKDLLTRYYKIVPQSQINQYFDVLYKEYIAFGWKAFEKNGVLTQKGTDLKRYIQTYLFFNRYYADVRMFNSESLIFKIFDIAQTTTEATGQVYKQSIKLDASEKSINVAYNNRNVMMKQMKVFYDTFNVIQEPGYGISGEAFVSIVKKDSSGKLQNYVMKEIIPGADGERNLSLLKSSTFWNYTTKDTSHKVYDKSGKLLNEVSDIDPSFMMLVDDKGVELPFDYQKSGIDYSNSSYGNYTYASVYYKKYRLTDKTKKYYLIYKAEFDYAGGFSNNPNIDGSLALSRNKTILTRFNTYAVGNATPIVEMSKDNILPIEAKEQLPKGFDIKKLFWNNVEPQIQGTGFNQALKSSKQVGFMDLLEENIKGTYNYSSKLTTDKYSGSAAIYVQELDFSKAPNQIINEFSINNYFSKNVDTYNTLFELAEENKSGFAPIPKPSPNANITSAFTSIADKDKYIKGSNINVYHDNDLWVDDGNWIFISFSKKQGNDLSIEFEDDFKVDSGSIKEGSKITVRAKVYNNSDKSKTNISLSDFRIPFNFTLTTEKVESYPELNGLRTQTVLPSNVSYKVISSPFNQLEPFTDASNKNYWTIEYELTVPTLPKLTSGEKYALNLVSAIPEKFDSKIRTAEIQNIYNESEDVSRKRIAFTANPSTTTGLNDMSLELWLEDSSGTKYNTKVNGSEDGNVFKLSDKPQVYKLKLKVKKEKGTAPIVNPVVQLKVRSGSDETFLTQNITLSKSLINPGDYAEYTYTNVNGAKYFIEADAKISDVYSIPNASGVILDDNPDNNRVHKIWTYELDLAVENVSVSPSKLTTPNKWTSSVNSTVVVNATIRLNSKDITSLNNVDVKLYINGSFYNGQQKTIGDGTQVSWNIPLRAYYAGNTPFKIIVNESRAIKEFSGLTDPYKNNEDIGVLSVNQHSDTRPKVCNGKPPVYSNSWSVKFTLQDGGGLSGPYTGTTCSKSGCRDYTYYICDNPYPPAIRYVPKTFNERLSLVLQYKSKKTNWNWVNAPSTLNIVAGEGFELKWTAQYYTDRPNMPSYKASCNSWRSPDASYLASIQNTTFTVDGYKFAELPEWFVSNQGLTDNYVINSNWSNYTVEYQIKNHVDGVGKTSRRLYTDVKDGNKSIVFGAWTNQFYGYGYTNDRWYEPSYGSGQKELCAYSQFTINIKNPLEITNQEIEKYKMK